MYSPDYYDESDPDSPTVSTLESFIEDVVREEIKDAEDYTNQVESNDRIRRWNRYYGGKLGNEKEGRSKYVSRDIIETVEWIMPNLMSTFVSSDPKIEISIEGQPASIGKALMVKIQEDLNDDDERSLYVLLYQWFKDALVSDTAFVVMDWDSDESSEKVRIPLANAQQMNMIYNSPDVEMEEYTDNGDGSYSDVDIIVTEVKDEKVNVDNIPHWDVIVSRHTKFINDQYGKGFKTVMMLDDLLSINKRWNTESGEDFFTGIDRLKSVISKRKENSSEKDSYMGAEDDDSSSPSLLTRSTQVEDGTYSNADPKDRVEVCQWYTFIDVNDDGILEPIICWVGEGEVLLRWDRNPDEMVMMSALSPILDCYKMFGIAYADLIEDLQNLKTMIIRRILDNFDFSTIGRTYVRPNGRVPIKELMQNIPGDTILADPDSVHTEYPKPFDQSALRLVEWVDSTKENRTGSTRYNQGTDADTLNKTATGMSMIQTASQKRIDMIARLFGETGMRDMYKKCVLLYRNNMTRPFTVKVDGIDVTVSPEMLKGKKITCKANLGIEAQIGMMEAEKVKAIFDFLAGVNHMFPGILGPEQVHNLCVKFVANMGNKNPESYVAIMDQFMQSLTSAQKQSQELQQVQVQLEREKVRVEWAKVQVAAKEAEIELKDVELNFQGRMETKKMDIAQKDRGDQLRFIADMAKALEQKRQRVKLSGGANGRKP
jgi:hypothetical protein